MAVGVPVEKDAGVLSALVPPKQSGNLRGSEKEQPKGNLDYAKWRLQACLRDDDCGGTVWRDPAGLQDAEIRCGGVRSRIAAGLSAVCSKSSELELVKHDNDDYTPHPHPHHSSQLNTHDSQVACRRTPLSLIISQ
jgi:hypothetical protein